jgi:hypothetical protein
MTTRVCQECGFVAGKDDPEHSESCRTGFSAAENEWFPCCSAYGCDANAKYSLYCERHAPLVVGVMRYDGLDDDQPAPDEGKVRIGIYAASKAYGGHEEGGWWYDTGEIVAAVECESIEDALRRIDGLSEVFPQTGKRNSVLGGEDYSLIVYHAGEELMTYYPEYIPTYE